MTAANEMPPKARAEEIIAAINNYMAGGDMNAQIIQAPEKNPWLARMEAKARKAENKLRHAISDIYRARLLAHNSLFGQSSDEEITPLLIAQIEVQAQKKLLKINEDLRAEKSAGVAEIEKKQMAKFTSHPRNEVFCLAGIAQAYLIEAAVIRSKIKDEADPQALWQTFDEHDRAMERSLYLSAAMNGISQLMEEPAAADRQYLRARKGAIGKRAKYAPSKEKARLLLVAEFERLVRMIHGADLPRVFRGKEHALKSIVKDLVEFHRVQNEQNGNDHLSTDESTVLHTLGVWFSKATLLAMAKDALSNGK